MSRFWDEAFIELARLAAPYLPYVKCSMEIYWSTIRPWPLVWTPQGLLVEPSEVWSGHTVTSL